MSWRDTLFPASYNDVPFNYVSHDHSGGRRLDVHEFPFRDRPQIDDLGRKAGEFSIEAYLIGDDYMVRRDRLLHELQRGGLGRLSHPYFGLINVGVQSYKISESTDQGRICRISMTFIDGDAISAGGVVVITADQVVSASATLKTAAATNLATLPKPSSPAALQERIGQLDALSRSLAADVNRLQSIADDLVEPVATVLRIGQTMRNDIQRIAALPDVTASTLKALADGVLGLFSDSPDVGYAVAMSWVVPASADALSQWQSSVGIAAAAEFMASLSFDSSAAALAARDEWLAAVEQVSYSADDSLYIALVDVRAAVVADINERAARLPVITSYTSPVTLPALVIAHQLYGDATRADDLVARNGIRHPGFVPGGRELEVLANG